MKSTVAVAYKAWRTRRLQEKKKSSIAVKAWKTRRSNRKYGRLS